MTIDEAIQHCNEISCEHDKCANEHKQLGEWLIELKELKDAHKQVYAWSEEDEANLKEALSYIKDDALKTFIKDRVQLRQEWSDEDKNNIIHCQDSLYYYYHSGMITIDEYNSASDLLNSLIIKTNWKPSDTQIEALKWQINNTNEGSWQYAATKELYNQLKELKGE